MAKGSQHADATEVLTAWCDRFWGRGGVPIGAITISAPSTRWGTAKAEAELLPHVLLAATSISNIMDNF